MHSQYDYPDGDSRLAEGDDPEERERETDLKFTMQYGNFGGEHWTNGRKRKGQKVTITDEFDNTGVDKRKPIDKLDRLFMYHDKGYEKAEELEMANNSAAAKAVRLKADLKLLAELKKLKKDVLAERIKLGISGSGHDTREHMHGHKVNAMHMLNNAIIFFSLKTSGKYRRA